MKTTLDSDAVQAFQLAIASSGARTEVSHDMAEVALLRLLESARAAWPEVRIPDAQFAAFVAPRIADLEDPIGALESVRVADLYLACACSHADPGAAVAFRAAYDSEIGSVVRRFALSDAAVDDIKQALYEKILVGTADRQPKITQYRGRGELRNWVRVTALRFAQSTVRRREPSHSPLESVLIDAAPTIEDQELRYLRQHYRAAFRSAFLTAIASLSSKERNILRYRYQEGRSVDSIASIYSVHRMTMTRWIASIRRMLLARTQLALAKNLQASKTEVSSVMRLVRSKFDITVGSLLAEEPASSGDSDPPPSGPTRS